MNMRRVRGKCAPSIFLFLKLKEKKNNEEKKNDEIKRFPKI